MKHPYSSFARRAFPCSLSMRLHSVRRLKFDSRKNCHSDYRLVNSKKKQCLNLKKKTMSSVVRNVHPPRIVDVGKFVTNTNVFSFYKTFQH
jgi:hypothetical protein